jgi:hypothetical protein
MIEKQLYKAAVQLYSKTIKVLKQHSHVLSFKNIQVPYHDQPISVILRVCICSRFTANSSTHMYTYVETCTRI